MENSFHLGYVIGVLVGDGSLSKCRDYHYFQTNPWKQVPKDQSTYRVPRWRYRFQLQVKDKDFAYGFAECLQKLTNRKPTIYPIIKSNTWKVDMTSQEWYLKLLPLTEDLNWLINANEETKQGFICGFFDSEGCASNSISSKFHIEFSNKNINRLRLVEQFLQSMGIERIRVYTRLNCGPQKNHSISNLIMWRKADAKTFYQRIGRFIKIERKKKIMESWFSTI